VFISGRHREAENLSGQLRGLISFAPYYAKGKRHIRKSDNNFDVFLYAAPLRPDMKV
jgi:hypothetical protein